MNRPLWQIAAIRIVFFGLLAALAQMAVVFTDYFFNDRELARLLVEQQVDALTEGVTRRAGRIGYALPEEMDDLFESRSGYFARVRTADGAVLFSACDTECEEHFLPLTVRPPDFWVRVILPGKPLHVAGGGRVQSEGQTLLIEFATTGDKDGLAWGVLWHEVLDHLVVPMSILLVFVILGTIVSIRAALTPVKLAAQAADALDPLHPGTGLATDKMPEEIGQLTQAVNRALARSSELIRSQRVLTSAIAHEVRTPLSILKLELSSMDHETARRAEAQVDELSDFVAQLTALARLEALGADQFVPTDLSALAEDLVGVIAPWVYSRGDSLAFEDHGTANVMIAPNLVRDACRNLVENAVRHTPPGTRIIVRSGPGAKLSVIDAPGTGGGPVPASEGLGIGLAVVERVLERNRARLVRDSSAEGTIVTILFQEHGDHDDSS